MLHCPIQVSTVTLINLGDGLVMFGRNGKSAHVRIDFDGLYQTINGLCKKKKIFIDPFERTDFFPIGRQVPFGSDFL
jgi:hypothetical protein